MQTKFYIFGSYISKLVEDDVVNNILINYDCFSISNIVYERKFFRGLKNINFHYFSSPTLGKYKRNVRIAKTNFKNERNVTYCNYSTKGNYIRKKVKAIKKCIKSHLIKERNVDNVVILIMEMHLPFQIGAFYLKKKLQKKNIKVAICSFCPDISKNVIDTTRKHSYFYYLAKKVYSHYTERLFKRSDKFVFFTKNMADYYAAESGRYIVIPAIQDIADKEIFFSEKKSNEMLFSGKLQDKNGLPLLLEYFKSKFANRSYILHICGSGENEDLVRNASILNKNIIFHGFVSPEKVRELQNRCLIVFCLRDPSWSGVLYSFPSKFFEALSTGNNVVATYLPTFDKETRSFVHFLNHMSIEELDFAIKKALVNDCLSKEKQYQYVSKYTPENVVKMIVDFLI